MAPPARYPTAAPDPAKPAKRTSVGRPAATSRRSDVVPVYSRSGNAAYARHAKPVGRGAPPALLKPNRRLPESRGFRLAIGTTVGLAVCVGLMLSGTPGYMAASQRIGQTTAPADTAAPYLAYDPGTTQNAVPVAAAAALKPGAASTPTNTSAEASGLAADGIPQTALLAYQEAAAREMAINPSCGLSWPLLAGIGRVESNHGRFAGATLHTDGVSTPKIIGIALDGRSSDVIRDTDQGRLDQDPVYDRAVGPLQFIPSTWAQYGVDANADGVADPFNIFDEAAGAAAYLCDAGKDLTTVAGQTRAIRTYNNNDDYIRLVLKLEGIYATGVPGLTVPVLSDSSPTPSGTSDLPPVNPGAALSAGSGAPGTTTPPATTVGASTGGGSTATNPGTGNPPAGVTVPSAHPAPPPSAQPAPPVVNPAPVPPANPAPPPSAHPSASPVPPPAVSSSSVPSAEPPSAVPAPPSPAGG